MRPTVETDCGSLPPKPWPTPAARDYRMPNNPNGASRSARPETSGKQLPNEVVAVLWNTPIQDDTGMRTKPYAQGGTPLSLMAARFTGEAALWSTIRASDGAKGSPRQAFGGGGQPLPAQAYQTVEAGLMQSGSSGPMEKLGGLNPEFVSWLMGFPDEWGSCAPTATPSSRRSQRK